MSSVKQQLQEISGYIDLGMFSDARKGIEALPTETQTTTEVLAWRTILYREAEEYELMEETALHLVNVQPEIALNWINYAYARRFVEGLDAACAVLQKAVQHFPDDADVLYPLAWHEAILGNLEDAQIHVRRAIELQPSLRITALLDPDLEAMIDT